MSCISISRLCSPNSISLAASPDSSDSLIVEGGPNAPPPAASSSCICVTMPSRKPSKSSAGSESHQHLGKHVHLTNCIHLRNRFHLQKHKMMVEARHGAGSAGLPLMRELTALSRTRSLRDPSTSSTLKSPLMKGVPGRKSEHPRGDESRNVSANSEQNNVPEIQEGTTDRVDEVSSRVGTGRDFSNREEHSRAGRPGNPLPKKQRKPVQDRGARADQEERPRKDVQRGPTMSRKLIMQLHQQQQQQQGFSSNVQVQGHSPSSLSPSIYDDPSITGLKFPPPQASRNSCESDPEASADDENDEEDVEEEPKKRSRSQSPLLSRDVSRKSRSPAISREIVKSRAFSFPDPSHPNKYNQHLGGHEDDVEGSEEPKHGCGIPWHWSRLGHKQKGKSFLDMAGRSVSSGYPDASAKRRGMDQILSRSQSGSGREIVTAMFPQDCLSYSSAANSDAEALPLLTEPDASVSGDVAGSSVEIDSDNVAFRELHTRRKSGSSRKGRSQVQVGTDMLQTRLKERLGWVNNLSDRRLHDEVETRQHRSLSHKYRPRTFRDMVGQHVVVQSLSNAVLRGKIVSTYLFQGPRGTGKSSAARIFAASLNCLSSEELRPCGLCRECVALNLGKSMDVREFDSSRITSHDSLKHLLENVMSSPSSARYRVSIVDECNVLSAESWNLLLRALEELHGYCIVILLTSNPEQLPRSLATRCQKYMFTKIKDADIVSRLQKMATKESIDVEVEALELIAARSNGSLRDAETTLDQVGLLGQTVTLATAQELIGLLPDDKLIELLDYALSGDAVNTVKSLRDLLDSGIEPLALMSQLATSITDVLAGTYKLPANQQKRRFFHKNTLNKEDLERLRQALKLLSEAEKQVRASSDQTTWLTAAVLQFAPERAYAVPSSSTRTSATQSLVAGTNDTSEKESASESGAGAKDGWENDNEHFGIQANEGAVFSNPEVHTTTWAPAAKSLSTVPEARIYPYTQVPYGEPCSDFTFDRKKLDEVWQKVLRGSRSKSLKKLLRAHGRLSSLTMQDVHAAVEIEFQTSAHKAKAEKSKARLTKMFRSALGCPVEVHLNLASKLHDGRPAVHPHDSLHTRLKPKKGQSPPHQQGPNLAQASSAANVKIEERLENAWTRQAHPQMTAAACRVDTHHPGNAVNDPSRIPLSVVMQQAGAQQRSETVSSQDVQYEIGEPLKFRRVKHLGPEVVIPAEDDVLEHANLRLECRTKSSRRLLCCWRARRAQRSDEERKTMQRRRRRRRACFFLRLVPCTRACTR